jgi:pyrroloquinoline quinone (PQQ) biosynthesis protein C
MVRFVRHFLPGFKHAYFDRAQFLPRRHGIPSFPQGRDFQDFTTTQVGKSITKRPLKLDEAYKLLRPLSMHSFFQRGKSMLNIALSTVKPIIEKPWVGLAADPFMAPEIISENSESKIKRGCSEDPAWVVELKDSLKPHWDAVLNCRLIRGAAEGTLSLAQMRGWMVQLYPFIECFPKWLALSIVRTQDPASRAFLIDNLRVEKKHAQQWIRMAEGFGVSEQELTEITPLPGVEALTHWLWSINTHGLLVEAVAATNYSIEGVTQGIAKSTVRGFPLYEQREGIHLSRKAYAWMEAHAKYDDLHPIYALEIIKRYAQTAEVQEKVKSAARRSLEFLLMALETCYTHFEQA